MDIVDLLQGRINYLEQENAYLKSLLARWLKAVNFLRSTNCCEQKEDKYGQEGTG